MAARRYARDNKGRFAPAGQGATARGGRLRTAAGNKRETVKASPSASKKLSSAPKGTIGKTRKEREIQQIDRPSEKKPAFKAAYQSQQAASRAAKSAPKEMSIEEFARKTGGKTRADSMSQAIEASRQPKGRTKAGDRRVAAARDKINSEVNATTAAYNKAIAEGKIKAPTTSLARKAQGEPSNPAVQAAQRLIAKTAAKRATNARMQRAQANAQRTADVRNTAAPGSKASFARRPSAKTAKSNRRAETAKEIYSATPERQAQIVRNQKGLARTEKARQNWMQTREQRIKNAEGTGLPPVKVGNKTAKPPSAAKPDTAAVNIPMSGTRGRSLDAEISRNIKQQQATARAADKARNRQAKSEQSRAKKLRDTHIGAIAKAKGLSKTQVESAFKAQPASIQIQALKNWVKQNRKQK